jgi:hydrogenase/urease accessory protein HupE
MNLAITRFMLLAEVEMGPFTIVPVWIAQDAMILIATVATIIFIVRKEEHPESFLMEMVCFTFLYAAVFENYATLVGLYGYGRSLLMVFNVPLTVPLVEYLVVYAGLRLTGKMRMPGWSRAIVTGLMGMLFDLSLDPLAIRQIHQGVAEASIGRWSWFPGSADTTLLGIPVYNFTGWILICGYAAALFLVGRLLYRRSGYKTWVGILYPVGAIVGALGALYSPLTAFLMWIGPFWSKGGVTEWIMLVFTTTVGVAVLALLWRGRMDKAISMREDWQVPMIFVSFHVANILFAVAGGHFEILWVQVVAAVAQIGILVLIWSRKPAVAAEAAG